MLREKANSLDQASPRAGLGARAAAGAGRTAMSVAICTRLDAASSRYTVVGDCSARAEIRRASGPSVAASWKLTLRHIAALGKIFAGTSPATIAVAAGQPSARNTPVPNRNR